MLKQRLDDADLALLEIIEDPIWCGEFLRSTSDGSLEKREWPPEPFEYEWYQRDILSDTSPYISVCAARSVGKCSPHYARIYTVDEGYQPISKLRKRRAFPVYALNDNGVYVQRRARIAPNGTRDVFCVTAANGATFDGTANHPMLTPSGYVPIEALHVGDRVAVITKLPYESTQRMFSFEELRWLGYVLGNARVTPEAPMPIRYKQQHLELEHIARVFDASLKQMADGRYHFTRKPGPMRSYMGYLLDECALSDHSRSAVRNVPDVLMRECLDHLRIFLEALMGAYADINGERVVFQHPSRTFCVDIQELLLRFGVETRLEASPTGNDYKDDYYSLTTQTYAAYYAFWKAFTLPGITVQNLKEPPRDAYTANGYRFEMITDIAFKRRILTYAVHVYEDHNYISDHFAVHNSLVFEDKIIHESINYDLYFPPESKEQLLATANKAQLDPILSRLIARFLNGAMLRDFLQNNINRSAGTFDFPVPGSSLPYRLTARIAGLRGETNMVGLHVPKQKFDEAQLFPMPAWVQIQPALNTWQKGHQQLVCGVPNGQRDGNVLYLTDQASPKFKKYRIPAPANRRFHYTEYMQSLRQYGGADSQDFRNLVLGEHGEPSFTLVPYEAIVREPYEMFTYRYTQEDKSNGKRYTDKLNLPKLSEALCRTSILAIDTGYTDPTLIQLVGMDEHGDWRTLVRWRLTRIPFPEQAEIIAWIDRTYHPTRLGIDVGAGGNGIALMQDLLSTRFPETHRFAERIHPVRFNDMIYAGDDPTGNPLKAQLKSYAAQTLAKMITEKEMRFSELDMEGISQITRLSAQRLASGESRFFVLSDTGVGTASDDHIFASYVCFIACLTTLHAVKPRPTKLFGASWG